jgi:acetyl-CoA acetyltransferase
MPVTGSRLRGATAVVGVGQTQFYQRGTNQASEGRLCVEAIVNACEVAGIDPRDVDGFVSYGSDTNSASRLAPSLGSREVKLSALVWGGGGGGIPGALNLAASQIYAGQAEIVVVYRAVAEGSGGRLRVAVSGDHTSAQYLVNGIDSPAQIIAFRSQRLIEACGVPRSALRAMAMADYYHANRNPLALGRNRVLDEETYESSRMISEPLHLFDCSRETDGAAAVVLVAAERAKDFADRPAYLLSAPMSTAEGFGEVDENQPEDLYTAVNFHRVAPRMWEESGYGPGDVDVVQVYEHFTGGAVGALIAHGFCSMEDAGDLLTFENLIAPNGRFPINTSGGNLGEAFLHGMNLVTEAVRQIRGESPNPVPDVRLSLMTGGPSVGLASSALFGTEETL